ncbi:sulfotransferase family 2 domain-containing protein [Roseibacterium sp. SDUM158017]|uniref:sulfotransferase family 2 domain-containing protein n=1 Tax=Roseicyclus salinarum TaxID=3036773 RepID=UPI0024153CD1|nr:sulfotransferase family 2 domain-containing protein [Roseibacterium sp. SDUM158017]MDG4649626.1 sulfotransferase family 2 domain-containing protein [Roseibacterium sp. SDUM158017]
MIISTGRNFGFVHIPKCAGSTIKRQLLDLHDIEDRFTNSMRHPELGRINANHLPLHVLERHFPEAFAALRKVESYTLLREPMDRFVSGVAQFVRDKGGEPGNMTPEEIRKTAYEIIDYMEKTPGLPDMEHTLFIRQSDYVSLGGMRIIDHVYSIDAIDDLMDRLEQEHGVKLLRGQVWNPTVTYKVPAMASRLKRLKHTAQKILPVAAYAHIRDLGVRLFTRKGAPNLTETLGGNARVRRFVDSYYAEDIALYDETLNAGRARGMEDHIPGGFPAQTGTAPTQ